MLNFCTLIDSYLGLLEDRRLDDIVIIYFALLFLYKWIYK